MASPPGPLPSPAPPPSSPPPRSPPPPSPLLPSNEYIPSRSSPPLLQVSESMRRMRHMLAAGKISITDTIHFSYPDIDATFTATPMEDGSLQSRAPRHPDAPLSPASSEHSPQLHRILSSSVHKLYSSPTEFASDMAHAALLADHTRAKQRGKISINGWDECSVSGRSLASIRNEMLREKHSTANTASHRVDDIHSTPPALVSPQTSLHPKVDQMQSGQPSNPSRQPPSNPLNSPAIDHEAAKHALHAIQPRQPDSLTPTQPQHTTAAFDAQSRSDPSQPSGTLAVTQSAGLPTSEPKGEKVHVSPPSSNEEKPIPIVKSIPTPLDNSAKTVDRKDETTSDPVRKNDNTIAVETKESTQEEGHIKKKSNMQHADTTSKQAEKSESPVQPDLIGNEDVMGENTHQLQSENQNKMDEANSTRNNKDMEEAKGDTIIHTVNPEDKQKQTQASSSKKEVQVPDNPKREASSSADAIEPAKPTSAPKKDIVTPRSSASPGNQDDNKEGDIDANCDNKRKERSPDIEMSSDGSEPIEAAKSPSPKPQTRKRKRSDSNGSSPSGDNTPSGRSPDRCTRPRTEAGRSSGKISVASTADVDTEGLDPDAIEAAAIAAQAEKEEASSRARRTTRLASGKIKQVDYKASAAALGQRGSSPGHEFEDGEVGFAGTESGTEPIRSTRRRTMQIQSSVPQRTSRRVTRQRGSQEKDQSSAEEVDHSAPRRMSSRGSGTDGTSNRADSDVVGVDDDMDIDTGFGSRLNGARSEGREKRRYKGDGTSKRARHLYREVVDEDEDRLYATKVSTRENSVVDAEEMTDLGDGNDREDSPEDMEDDANPNTRTDVHGWTISDITAIASAVKKSGSTDPGDIVDCLRDEKGWRSDDTKLKRVMSYIVGASKAIKEIGKKNSSSESNIRLNDIVTFLATDVWRLRSSGNYTGFPRRPTSLMNRAHREEVVKNNMERSRKKSNRELDDLRVKLESEMDSRRKVDLDAAYLDVQLREAQKILSRETDRRWRIEKEIERYKLMEADARNRLDRTKILVGHLRGEKGSHSPIRSQKIRKKSSSEKEAECTNGEMGKGTVGESITSEDDVEMRDKDIEGNGQKALEMDRLRGLIAAREAEAEGFQRICEKERSNFVGLLEMKNRLETELYLQKSVGPSGSSGAGIATSSASHPGKVGKEGSRKGDGRTSGTAGSRGPGISRGKGNAMKGSSVVGGVSSNAKGSSNSSKLKSTPGKNGDGMKGVKRKTTSKGQSNGVDKA